MKRIVKYEVLLLCVLLEWTRFTSPMPTLLDQKGRQKVQLVAQLPYLGTEFRVRERESLRGGAPALILPRLFEKGNPTQIQEEQTIKHRLATTNLIINYSLLTCCIVIFLFPFAAFHSRSWLNTS